MKKVAVFCNPNTARYGFGDGHPFGPDRQAAFVAGMQARGLDREALVLPSRSAVEQDLLRFHTVDYVDFVRARCAREGGYLDFGDTPAMEHVFDAGLAVVGAVLRAAEMLVDGHLDAALVPIAGLHHAGRNHAAGFCVFSDIGIVIEYLRSEHDIRRILYVDIDAHHGDGVFYAYESDPDVWILDSHQDGRTLYPGSGDESETGSGEAAGHKCNIALPPGADSGLFRARFAEAEAFIAASAPQFVILQCGADAMRGDPITQLGLAADDYAFVTERLLALTPGVPLLALGGGGYNRDNLAAAWNAVLAALLAHARASNQGN